MTSVPSSPKTRRKTGCLNCRARRKKCDEVKPTCSRCKSFNDVCRWDKAFRIQSVQDFKDGERSSKRQRTSNAKSEDGAPSLDRTYSLETSVNGNIRAKNETGSTNPASPNTVPEIQVNPSTPQESVPPNLSRQSTDFISNEKIQQSVPSTNYYFDNIDLGTLDYLTSHTSNIDLTVQNGDTWTPEDHFELSLTENSPALQSPGIHYANAQYRELQTTLHQHMVETARSTVLNRRSSIDSIADIEGAILSDETGVHNDGVSHPSKVLGSNDRASQLSSQRQLVLWRNYLDEIAPWLDMLDSERHFRCTVPLMAKSAPHLFYSIMAISARQMEQRLSDKSHTESIGLYQQAIHLVVHRIQYLETEVITACVLLCVLEMMSSSPRAWVRHLDGCAMLLEAAGINGAVGGIRQALFWCFARMDVWAGYLGDTITKIPTYRWFIPSGSMATAVSQLKDGASVDTYANYAVFLCASVINVISTQEFRPGRTKSQQAEISDLFSTRWKALYDLLEGWYTDRPEELLPIMLDKPALTDYEHPFPVVLYATTLGSSGNQMYHAAALLMLQHKPKDVRLPKTGKSILWHARQICGITTSNTDHATWTNALQPLWMAGRSMSHSSEHQAILNILAQIEKQTGFATQWRANDLKEYWGDMDG